MTHKLNEVINNLQRELGNHRINLNDHIFTRFVGGSPDEALKSLESQMNHILDERDDLLINALAEIKENYTDALQRTITLLDEERHDSQIYRKTRGLSKDIGRGVH